MEIQIWTDIVSTSAAFIHIYRQKGCSAAADNVPIAYLENIRRDVGGNRTCSCMSMKEAKACLESIIKRRSQTGLDGETIDCIRAINESLSEFVSIHASDIGHEFHYFKGVDPSLVSGGYHCCFRPPLTLNTSSACCF